MRKTTFRVCLVLAILIMTVAFGSKNKDAFKPVIDGNWWSITSQPDLGKYTDKNQQPVDFAVWKAKDGTWQLWSCIRHTRIGGKTRLFYRWESKSLTDTA